MNVADVVEADPFAVVSQEWTSSLRRLRKMAETDGYAAKLREKVLMGEMSANRTLLEMRTRRKYHTVEATPGALAAFAKKHLKPAQVKRLIHALS